MRTGDRWFHIPLIQRAGNAVVSYMAYLGQMLWPANLAVFYPHPGGDLPAWETLLALAGLAILSARRHRGEGTAAVAGGGWLWYLGMLAPVIGMVQSGDRRSPTATPICRRLDFTAP